MLPSETWTSLTKAKKEKINELQRPKLKAMGAMLELIGPVFLYQLAYTDSRNRLEFRIQSSNSQQFFIQSNESANEAKCILIDQPLAMPPTTLSGSPVFMCVRLPPPSYIFYLNTVLWITTLAAVNGFPRERLKCLNTSRACRSRKVPL